MVGSMLLPLIRNHADGCAQLQPRTFHKAPTHKMRALDAVIVVGPQLEDPGVVLGDTKNRVVGGFLCAETKDVALV